MDTLIGKDKLIKPIQSINKDSVHKICSGQVILNLAIAVKELVENSLDAGATFIEVRLKEYGSETVEVIDNGSGVEESNMESLTLKHHTSKLQEFDDLTSVETFGFRGEALSSLCALSDMTIVTRHKTADCGMRLQFDRNGHIKLKQPCARQVGTTVTLQNLFSPLPVRQKEFLRNLQREFAKMMQLLYAYCLVSTGVKINCSNISKKGGRKVIVSTQGSSSVQENIACVFGAKQNQSLLQLVPKVPNETLLQEFGFTGPFNEAMFKFEGYISSCEHGSGRSTTDRQFFFINSRPCEPSKVIRMINEVYHQFNQSQYPFVFLNMKTARKEVDVNVTPDKRQIFLENEKVLLLTVKASLLHLFENIPSTMRYQNLNLSTSAATVSTPTGDLGAMFRQWQKSPADTDNSISVKGVKRSASYRQDGNSSRKVLCVTNFFTRIPVCNADGSKEKEGGNDDVSKSDHGDVSEEWSSLENRNIVNDSNGTMVELETITDSDNVAIDALTVADNENVTVYEPTVADIKMVDVEVMPARTSTNSGNVTIETLIKAIPVRALIDNKDMTVHELTVSDVNSYTESASVRTITDIENNMTNGEHHNMTLHVTLDDIRECTLQHKKRRQTAKEGSEVRVRFRAEINPSKNKMAEQELSKEITKEMFAKMEILGQFNLGFIITRLGPDLFIIDQHATDEKYNFEILQRDTVFQNQKLVVPQTLELTAANESILIENAEIFRRNGFDIAVDEKAEPMKRVKLQAIPVSKNWHFGKDDIDELLFMLQDSPHTMCRPSRVRAMFASRACRKSVMIGTALSKSDMRRLVDHMGELEQPWNCPHGRPTMRHLVNLDLLHL